MALSSKAKQIICEKAGSCGDTNCPHKIPHTVIYTTGNICESDFCDRAGLNVKCIEYRQKKK